MADARVAETERLILRPGRDADVVPLYAIGQDAEVMRYPGPPPSLADATAVPERMAAHGADIGYCFWAVERKSGAAFIGFRGLLPAKPLIDGEVEIGWRLACEAWGRGYAREAAQASMDWAWRNLDAPGIVAITVPANARSWGLMERLGMGRVQHRDFDHPDLPDGGPLRYHICTGSIVQHD